MTTAQPEALLRVTGVASGYGRIRALHGIDLEVGRGQLVALVGANGAGKTTFLRAISGVQPVTAGEMSFDGMDVNRMSAHARVRGGICQVPEGRQIFGPMTVEDNLRLGAVTRRDGDIAADFNAMLELFPVLKTRLRSAAGNLSGGQQQMLAMARALMGRPKLLLLDEPSMGLAPLLVQEIFAIIRRLREEGRTVLLVEQNAQAALTIADRGYVLETGRVVLSGSGQELLADPEVRRAYLGM